MINKCLYGPLTGRYLSTDPDVLYLTIRAPGATDLRSLLCYSCRLTIKDMVSKPQLTHFCTDRAFI